MADSVTLTPVDGIGELTIGETVLVESPPRRAVEAGLCVQRLLALATAHAVPVKVDVRVTPGC